MQKPLLLIAMLAAMHAGQALADADLPAFEDCPTPVQASKKPVQPKLKTAQSRRYASELRQAARDDINFAGHYVLATWGCGAGCVMGGAIDAQTGKVLMLPFTVSDWPLEVSEPLSFKAESCLLIVEGSRNEQGRGRYFYALDGNRFKLLKAIEQ